MNKEEEEHETGRVSYGSNIFCCFIRSFIDVRRRFLPLVDDAVPMQPRIDMFFILLEAKFCY